MGSMASQITSFTIVYYSAVYSGADQRKYQSSASLAFVRGIHRRPVNSAHKWPVTRKIFPFDDVIMIFLDNKVNTIAANARVACVTIRSTTMVLTLHTKNGSLLNTRGKVQLHVPYQYWEMVEKVYMYMRVCYMFRKIDSSQQFLIEVSWNQQRREKRCQKQIDYWM